MIRCPWSEKSQLLTDYHDTIWGKLQTEDVRIFEALTLESMQAGLSFEIILKKSSALKEAFYNWDLTKISQMKETDIHKLLLNSELIRHQRKLEAVVENAKGFLRLQKEFGSFFNYLKTFFLNILFTIIIK